MSISELAESLNGREYPFELTFPERAQAKALGLVVVFGASDDLCEIRGAIQGEVGCYNGGTILFNTKGVVEEPDSSEIEVLDKYGLVDAWKKDAASFDAIWNLNGISWAYEVPFPHATFEIKEDGETYCVGFVFRLSDAIGGAK